MDFSHLAAQTPLVEKNHKSETPNLLFQNHQLYYHHYQMPIVRVFEAKIGIGCSALVVWSLLAGLFQVSKKGLKGEFTSQSTAYKTAGNRHLVLKQDIMIMLTWPPRLWLTHLLWFNHTPVASEEFGFLHQRPERSVAQLQMDLGTDPTSGFEWEPSCDSLGSCEGQ